MEAMEKIKSGQKFNEVASQYSEDKARQGVSVLIACQLRNSVTGYLLLLRPLLHYSFRPQYRGVQIFTERPKCRKLAKGRATHYK